MQHSRCRCRSGNISGMIAPPFMCRWSVPGTPVTCSCASMRTPFVKVTNVLTSSESCTVANPAPNLCRTVDHNMALPGSSCFL